MTTSVISNYVLDKAERKHDDFKWQNNSRKKLKWFSCASCISISRKIQTAPSEVPMTSACWS